MDDSGYDDSVYVAVDNEGNVIGVFRDEEAAMNCCDDYEFPAYPQGPFPID
jgi:uncharacterized protein YuzE